MPAELGRPNATKEGQAADSVKNHKFLVFTEKYPHQSEFQGSEIFPIFFFWLTCFFLALKTGSNIAPNFGPIRES